MSANGTTLEQVVGYIISQADETAVTHIANALRERQKALHSIRAAAVTEGTRVRIVNIKPKYLAGLEGEVTRIEPGRSQTYANVLLDEASTQELRLNRPGVGSEKRHELTGVPASCCEVLK